MLGCPTAATVARPAFGAPSATLATTLSVTRPRSSADRAAGFEPASGGSTPPGAISLPAPPRPARIPGMAFRSPMVAMRLSRDGRGTSHRRVPSLVATTIEASDRPLGWLPLAGSAACDGHAEHGEDQRYRPPDDVLPAARRREIDDRTDRCDAGEEPGSPPEKARVARSCPEARATKHDQRGACPHDDGDHAPDPLAGREFGGLAAPCSMAERCARCERRLEDRDDAEPDRRHNRRSARGTTTWREPSHPGTRAQSRARDHRARLAQRDRLPCPQACARIGRYQH